MTAEDKRGDANAQTGAGSDAGGLSSYLPKDMSFKAVTDAARSAILYTRRYAHLLGTGLT